MNKVKEDIERVLDSKDIEEICIYTANICSNVIKLCLDKKPEDIDMLSNIIKIIEDSMKINDIVIIKDILKYEISKYIEEIY